MLKPKALEQDAGEAPAALPVPGNGNGLAHGNGNGVVHGNGNGNGVAHSNGNGVVHSSGNGNGNGVAHSNGNGNGNGAVHANGNGVPSAARRAALGIRLKPANDERLVGAVRAGSEAAFAEIYERHSRQLFSFCRHMLGTQHEAEDALQQTFLRAYSALRSSANTIILRPWLFAIARNECLTLMRKRDKTLQDPEQIEVSTNGLPSKVEQREELRSMLHDITKLPEEQREALLLSSLGSLSGEEIGEVLECDREKVKSLVFRARQSLGEMREARDTTCEDIQAQLSVLRGGSLRRKVIREHLLECEGCRDFRLEVRRQRQLTAALLPAAPSGIATLVFSGIVGTGAKAVAGGAGPLAGIQAILSAAGGKVATTAAVSLIAAGPVVGGEALDGLHRVLSKHGDLSALIADPNPKVASRSAPTAGAETGSAEPVGPGVADIGAPPRPTAAGDGTGDGPSGASPGAGSGGRHGPSQSEPVTIGTYPTAPASEAPVSSGSGGDAPSTASFGAPSGSGSTPSSTPASSGGGGAGFGTSGSSNTSAAGNGGATTAGFGGSTNASVPASPPPPSSGGTGGSGGGGATFGPG